MDIVDDTCSKCWGRGTVVLDLGKDGGATITCPRCKGTGEEPDDFSWLAVLILAAILIIGLYFVWEVQ